MDKKEISRRLDDKRNGLLNEWKICWRASERKDKALKDFEELFGLSYQKIIAEKEANKRRNYRWKRAFLIDMVIGGVGILLLFIWQMCTRAAMSETTWRMSVILLLFTISGIIILKWIDIKKFQETWARHSRHQQKIENEMLKFLSGIAPYDKIKKNEIFARRIMVLWEKDQEKFNRNMEEKEKGLADALKYWELKR